MDKPNLTSVFGKSLEYFQGIEFDDFITLQPHHIKEAIPELVPLIKFENTFKKFIESMGSESQVASIANESSNTVIDEAEAKVILDFASGLEPIFDEESFNVIDNIIPTVSISSSDVLIPASGDIKTKILTVQDIIDIPNIKLKIIITKHVDQNKSLSDFDRVVVAKAIIHHLLVREFYRVIKKEEFIHLAKLIVQLFPKELSGTYYIPAVKNQPAEGKLFFAYQNYKKDLREAALIPKRSTKPLNHPDEKSVQLAEKSDAFKAILEESDDFDRILRLWCFCYEERQHLLNEFSVFEYVRKFPAFKLPKGYELLTLDAEKLLGSKTSQLCTIAPKLILYASRKKRSSLEIKDILIAFQELSANLDNLDLLQQLTAIRLLPHLMPFGKRKLNKTTVSHLFCPLFKSEAEADRYNVEFKEDYKQSNLVLKPRLYLFGDLSSPKAHIYIADQKYIIESFVLAFETLFKCFLGLNCSYPEETLHVWQFIQSEVFGIESEKDKKSSTVLTFIQDIRNIAVN